METKSYLIFNLHDVQYGIAANLVKEIFLLPALLPIAEAPIDIVGILNLRGKVVPVMHLDLRLGNPMQECRISDSVIVLEWKEFSLGTIVNAVHEVKTIDSSVIEKGIDYGRVRDINPAFVEGIAKVDGDMIVLLNPEALIREPDAVEALIKDESQNSSEKSLDSDAAQQESKVLENQLADNNESSKITRIISTFYDLCCPNATEKERAVFRQRAENLKQAIADELGSNLDEQIPLAVISLNEEYFGINLSEVREFTKIRNLTPIPCCPKHIVGNMNLRGEIVTLLDIRKALNLPINPVKLGSKAVVINVDDVVAGLPVDEVFDVIYLSSSEVTCLPVAANSKSNAYLQGTVPFSDKMLTILELKKLMKNGDLVVSELV